MLWDFSCPFNFHSNIELFYVKCSCTHFQAPPCTTSMLPSCCTRIVAAIMNQHWIGRSLNHSTAAAHVHILKTPYIPMSELSASSPPGIRGYIGRIRIALLHRGLLRFFSLVTFSRDAAIYQQTWIPSGLLPVFSCLRLKPSFLPRPQFPQRISMRQIIHGDECSPAGIMTMVQALVAPSSSALAPAPDSPDSRTCLIWAVSRHPLSARPPDIDSDPTPI